MICLQTSLPEEKNQLDLLEKLRDLKHLHIINHIWMAWSSSSSLLVVCTDFLPGKFLCVGTEVVAKTEVQFNMRRV